MNTENIETRGRPRNEAFVVFCEGLASKLPLKRMADASEGDSFVVSGALLNGQKREYKNFRNAVALTALKQDLVEHGFKVSVYFAEGEVHLKVTKV